MAAYVDRRAIYQERWFGHNDFETPIEHDIDCRVGACWPSSLPPCRGENGLTQKEVMRKTHALVSDDPKHVVCEVTNWGHSFSYKAWKVADHETHMLFVRGHHGDHALVYSTERFALRSQLENSTW